MLLVRNSDRHNEDRRMITIDTLGELWALIIFGLFGGMSLYLILELVFELTGKGD